MDLSVSCLNDVQLRSGNFHFFTSINVLACILNILLPGLCKIHQAAKHDVYSPAGLCFDQDDQPCSHLKAQIVVTLIQKNILDGHVTDVFLRRVQILRMQRFTQLLSAFILYVFSSYNKPIPQIYRVWAYSFLVV